MDVITLLVIYLLTLNLIGFAIMGMDKYKARKHAWRVPEATLFVIAIIGGAVGTILGMYLFRHKIRKWYFVYGLPAIFALQAILFLIIMNSLEILIM